MDQLEGACLKMSPKTETVRHRDQTIIFRADLKKTDGKEDWEEFWKVFAKTKVVVSHNFGCIHFEREPATEHTKD